VGPKGKSSEDALVKVNLWTHNLGWKREDNRPRLGLRPGGINQHRGKRKQREGDLDKYMKYMNTLCIIDFYVNATSALPGLELI
jgi:hypothetical protein